MITNFSAKKKMMKSKNSREKKISKKKKTLEMR